MSTKDGWNFVNTTKIQGYDQIVSHYQKVVHNLQRTSTYSFYSDATTGIPVMLHMLGYDFVVGSHYDEYEIAYSDVTLGPKATHNSSRFAPPGPDCGGYPPSDPREGGPGDNQDWQKRHVVSAFGSVRESLEQAAAVGCVPGSGSHPTSGPSGWPDCTSPETVALMGSDSEPIECAYERWAVEHGRDLAALPEQELRRRLSRFRTATRVVGAAERSRRRASSGTGFTARLTHLADWTAEEVSALKGTRSPL